MKVEYLGHSVLLIETNQKNIIVDPFVKGNPQCPISLSDLPKINYVLVTHGHSDHLGDTMEISKRDRATVISNFEICEYLESKGAKTHSMHIGGSFNFDFGSVKLTPAFHGSSINDGNNVLYAGMPSGFLINSNGKKIYHAGDTGLTLEMQLLKEEMVDVAFIPIGGNFVMDANDAAKATSFIMPKVVVPIHYNTWDIIKADAEKFKVDVEKLNVQCNIMKPGEWMEI